VGLSDHTLGIGVSVASVALGATVIEKHFTLNRADGGVDSTFSMEPHEMTQLVIETERAWSSLGKVYYGPTQDELKSLQFRRSLYITQDLKSGDVLSLENVRAIRPGLGLPVKHLPHLLGKKINQDVPRGTPLTWQLIG
jgi:N-acetylneuraminate synthase